MIRPGDIIVMIALLLLLSVGIIVPLLAGSETTVAKVYLDGEEVFSVDLADLNEKRTETVSGCEVLFEKDGVSVTSADCENRFCVRQGKISRPGESVACVPNRVVIVIEGEGSNADVVAY